MNKKNLRQISRAKRRALSSVAQQRAAHALLKKFSRHPLFRCAKHIAFYLPNDGEISPLALMRYAKRKHKQCYLPALNKKDALVFRRYQNRGELTRNKFGILEPQMRCREVAPYRLDLVLMPLVAFDSRGNRLGMGGGYYDRCFAYKRPQPLTPPILVGVAHSCQQAAEPIEFESWDIAMDYILTDREVLTVRAAR